LFIIVFGGGGRRRGGCSGLGCLIWILISIALSLGLTVLVNLLFYLMSSPVPGIPEVDV
jgi:hypothetical protein